MNARVLEFVLAAGDYVRRATGLELDGSVESLAFVDHYLSQVGQVSDELLALAAPAIGAYFGEVVVARLGGEWSAEAANPADWTISVGDGAPGTRGLLRFHPVAMAAEALRRAAVDGYDASLTPPSALEEPLANALASGSPVEESYYYSLTGRLETLEHVLELLVELRRLGAS